MSHITQATRMQMSPANDSYESVAARMRSAFAAIDAARARRPGAPIRDLISEARAQLGLTDAEMSWIHWTLAPEELAVQPKEPRSRR